MAESARHTKRIVRVQVASATKVGGTLGVVVGFVGGLASIVYVLKMPTAPGTEPAGPALLAALPVLAAGVIGLDGMILGALCAWTFNVTGWLTGGLAIEEEEGAGA